MPRPSFVLCNWRVACVLVLALAGGAVAACVSDDPGPVLPPGAADGGAADGAEGGACFGNGTCLTADLACLSNRCVRAAGSGSDAGSSSDGGGDAGPTCEGVVPPVQVVTCFGDGGATTCAKGQTCCAVTGEGATSCKPIAAGCDEELATPLGCGDSSGCTDGSVCCALLASRAACEISVRKTECVPECVGDDRFELCSQAAPCKSADLQCEPRIARGVGSLPGTALGRPVGVCAPR